MAERRSVTIRPRSDTSENWVKVNPVLDENEMAFEIVNDGTCKLKFGNGRSCWSELPYSLDLQAIGGGGDGQPTSIFQYNTHFEFPNVGQPNCIYIDKIANKTYRWDSVEGRYYVIGSDYEDIKVIYGGTA